MPSYLVADQARLRPVVGRLQPADGPNVTVRSGGTVTFLFTDIEGSTGLLKRLGSRALRRAAGRAAAAGAGFVCGTRRGGGRYAGRLVLRRLPQRLGCGGGSDRDRAGAGRALLAGRRQRAHSDRDPQWRGCRHGRSLRRLLGSPRGPDRRGRPRRPGASVGCDACACRRRAAGRRVAPRSRSLPAEGHRPARADRAGRGRGPSRELSRAALRPADHDARRPPSLASGGDPRRRTRSGRSDSGVRFRPELPGFAPVSAERSGEGRLGRGLQPPQDEAHRTGTRREAAVGRGRHTDRGLGGERR